MTTALKYTICEGDTYWNLAEKFNECAGVTWEEIAAANPNVSPNNLRIGQVINIPAPGGGEPVLKYTVVGGKTYYTIAQELNVCKGITASDIEAANPGIQSTSLRIGKVINIPSDQTTSSPQPQIPPGTDIIGYYSWTWSGAGAPADTTLDVAFSGWVDPKQALSDSASVYGSMKGSKYICLGGGNDNGRWSSDVLNTIIKAIDNGEFTKYPGIAFDIEVGDKGLLNDFRNAFKAARKQNLKVLVTISHSAPYGIKDAPILMQGFFSDENIDYLSPQLYTTGKETLNDYAISHNVQWKAYCGANADVVPSIVSADMYQDALEYFGNIGVTLKGFIQWAQIR